MMSDAWSTVPLIAGASLLLCLVLSPLARRIGLLDHPHARKVHDASTPLVGGFAIYIPWLVMVVLLVPNPATAVPLLLATAMMLFAGAWDDMHELRPLTRFIVQIIACCIMIFASGVVLNDFGSLLWNGVLGLGWLSVPLTIFAALGVINAFNMMDGIDGLSSTIFIIAGSAMAWLALRAGLHFNASLLLLAVGAVAGFFLVNAQLPWNQSARVFLGDSGSMFLGLLLAWQFIDLGNGADRAFAPMTAVWLFGIPLLDTTRIMVHRWREGRSSMEADQYHLHHAFLRSGFSVVQTSIAITALILFTTLVGLAGEIFDWPEYLMFYGYIAFGLYYNRVMGRCWREGRFLGRVTNLDPE